MRHSALSVVLLGLTLPASAQQTWVVDDDGPADITQIQAAVGAASDGDTILVRAGTYLPVVIAGKGLILQAEGQATIGFDFSGGPSLTVKDLAPSQSVRLHGFDVFKLLGSETPMVRLEDNAGAVVIEEFSITGSGPSGIPLTAFDCASVTLRDCTLEAQQGKLIEQGGILLGTLSYPGIVGADSNLHLYDCEVTGGKGWFSSTIVSTPPPPGPGEPAVELRGGSLFASGCVLTGGEGGVISGPCFSGADGGPALVVDAWTGPGGTARLLDTGLYAGVPSAGSCGNPDGVSPPPVVLLDGVVESLAGAARSFEIASPATAGGPSQLSFSGIAGDAVILLLAPDVTPGVFLPAFGVVQHLPSGYVVFPMGSIPGGGALDLPVSLGLLSSPFTSATLSAQAIFLSANGVFDGGPSTLTILGTGL